MRISFNGRYTNLGFYQTNIMSSLQSDLNKMGTGLKIKMGYEDSTIFNKTLIADYSLATLKQTKEVATTANTLTKHTDTALTSMSKLLMQFNTKLVQGLSDANDSTSLQAIAGDLRSIRNNILSLSNTAIGGQYIFAGTAINTPPFAQDGSYLGNSQLLQAVLGDKNKLPYNIPGSELMFGHNRDQHKEIVTNIKHYNQSYLNPGIMDDGNRTELPKEVYITANDTLRDLIGDDDFDTTNNAPEVFYIQGTRPDGSSFKAKFEMDLNYKDTVDKKDAIKVKDLLDKIGEAYGNTSTNKVVDVSINEYGQIKIRDMSSGSSELDFYMVSSNHRNFNKTANGELAGENGGALSFHTQVDEQGAPVGNPLGQAVYNAATGQYELKLQDKNGNDVWVPVTYEKNNVFSYTNPLTGKKEKLHAFEGANPSAPVVDGLGVDDINDLTKYGARVTTYIQSNFLGEKNSSSLNSTMDPSDHRRHTLPTTFRTEGNTLATWDTKLIDVLGAEAIERVRNGGTLTINLGGTSANNTGTPPTPGGPANAKTITLTKDNMNTYTMRDLTGLMEEVYGGKDRVRVELNNGKITVVDQNVTQNLAAELPANRVSPFDGPSSLKINIGVQLDGADFNVFANDYTVEYDRVQFTQNGSTMTGNVSQIVNGNNEYANMETKLSEVAGSSLSDTKYTLTYKDIDGQSRTATINFYGNNPRDINGNPIPQPDADKLKNTVTITVENPRGGAPIEIPLFRPLDKNSMPHPDGKTVLPISPDEITYKQLSDAISVALNLGRSDTNQLDIIRDPNASDQQKKDAYETLLRNSNANLSVGLNMYGQLEIKDSTRSPSLMSFSLNESQRQVSYMTVDGDRQTFVVNGSGDYGNIPPRGGVDINGNPLKEPASKMPYRDGPALTFQSNNALVLDDPHVNVFQKLDEAIRAVELEIYRAGDIAPGNYHDGLRSVGMQGAKQWLEHVEKQINKVHSKVGSQGKALEYEVERSEMLILQTKELRSNTIDADIPETYSSFVQLTMNYQALLSATSKINSLSLMNYI